MTKIDIVSGFLGAGKTTLIKKLLKEALAGTKVVLIENEFGQIGIDGGFLKESGIEIREMNAGCICCSLVGDFGTSLKEVMETYAPERILIEPSGVGKLSDVMRAINDASEHTQMHLNSAVAVVDASKCKVYLKNFGEFFNNQIAYAGTIILTRTDKVSQEKIEECIELLRAYNKDATIITTPIADLDGKAAGYCFCEIKDNPATNNTYAKKELYIDDLCVNENYRGKGVAKELFGYVKKFAITNHFDCITLNVWAGNNRAENFYKKQGFIPRKTMMEIAFS